MNIYAIIILVTIVFGYVLGLITELLNLGALKDDLPSEFDGVYDAGKYTKSQEYTRIRTRFGFITSTFSIVLTLVFWFVGGFNVLDQLVGSWNLHPIVTGLAYMGVLIAAEDSREAGAFIIGTGRSDFPKQVNNVLAFPGVFRGAIDTRAKVIDAKMKIEAAYGLAACVKNPTVDEILPSPLDKSVAERVADSVRQAYERSVS